MMARRFPMILAAAAGILAVAGCPSTSDNNNNNNGGNGGTNGAAGLVGTWSGVLSITRTQTLGTTTGAPATSNSAFSLTFSDDGKPTDILVFGFSGSPNQTAELKNDGDTATLTSTSNGLNVTIIATVSDVTYSENGFVMNLALDYSGSGGSLNQDGSATMVIEGTRNGDSLEISITVDYNVQQTASTFVLDTGEDTTATATLARQ